MNPSVLIAPQRPSRCAARRAAHVATVRIAAAMALALALLTALVEVFTTRGPPSLVVHPVYAATLVPAALLAAHLARRLREMRLMHALVLTASTLGLQLALIVLWGAAISWIFAAG